MHEQIQQPDQLPGPAVHPGTGNDAVRQRVVQCAQGWLGTPYHHRANVKGAGVDCAWLLIEAYSEAGVIEPFDPGAYPPDWMLHRDEERYLSFVFERAREVTRPRMGDVVVMRFGRTYSHGAIYAGDGLIVHSYVRRGCQMCKLDEFSHRPMRYFDVIGD